MALVVEDGSGKTDAESYIDLEFADTYHTDRGNSAWAEASDSEREQALRKAADYIDSAYRFVGFRKSADQSLAWPRQSAVDPAGRAIDVVPSAVKQAQAVAALILLSRDLYAVAERGGRVKRVQVGPVTQEFSDSASDYTDPQEVTALLHEIVRGRGSVKVERS